MKTINKFLFIFLAAVSRNTTCGKTFTPPTFFTTKTTIEISDEQYAKACNAIGTLGRISSLVLAGVGVLNIARGLYKGTDFTKESAIQGAWQLGKGLGQIALGILVIEMLNNASSM